MKGGVEQRRYYCSATDGTNVFITGEGDSSLLLAVTAGMVRGPLNDPPVTTTLSHLPPLRHHERGISPANGSAITQVFWRLARPTDSLHDR